ncbi:hypothetical protein [Lacticaseibacillus sharpeae]|uniref:Methyl-accepting chemotaxis protein n=1 Tax=Lacticaseibacillus sharpeae JCM 1186 = DSM 20505 TaxID=1291052 RepID=A0A0R1ZIU7_9LACO|nr:hypothetical protein [Lacticaseibacillus sharpeae]KRM54357.1 hypothetical protein FC18_GL000577 [Lacticaseibacillus sharpeae JCM 1186 = DSM 20505]
MTMNKNQQKMAQYGYTINNVMSRTDELQDELNPLFIQLREAIDNNKVDDFKKDDYEDIRSKFAAGTAEYAEMLKKFESAQVPARFIGNHKLLTKAFASFVEGCQQMTDSLGDDKQIDVDSFNAAEKQQDEASEKVSKFLNKIQVLV